MVDQKQLYRMYLQLQRCRKFEETVNQLFLEGRMPGTLHLYPGQEACAVGVCENLNDNDWVIGTHRPHGHAIAKGVGLKPMMAELFAKTDGCAGGYGGSMHVGDPAHGAMTAIAIVGGNIPVATGMALAFKMQKSGQVVCCFTGDGSVNEGAFHEGVNMAAIWNLPVVFVVENNRYGASTPIGQVVKLDKLAERAAGYGIPGITADGMNVLTVYEEARKAIVRARNGEGPTLLELETYRFGGHSRSDTRSYRTKEEEAFWLEKDPIIQLEREICKVVKTGKDDIEEMTRQVEREIEDSIAFAEASPSPRPEDCLNHVFTPAEDDFS